MRLLHFEIDRDIIGTKLLTKFHEGRKRNVPSRKYTQLLKTARPPGNHIFQRTETIFELNSHIKETNVLTKFHENWAENVTSRVFTCFHCIHIEKNAPPTGGHVFSPIWTIFELVREINKTNCLQVFFFFLTYFELGRDIIGTKLLTKFHEDHTINVAS
ncbi:hypothetical protein DPMN_024886 [Dreissena polymorpha]|uniref:Uncharacterized protein n=1 Tax=Dreissena polymorpha TaxID=45954 RepID=A0A9D4RCS6_DREPO|nr:hypothetical protein DPMN_024886 [Dreissena polymorpha]